LKSSAARAQTVPSIHAQRQAHARAVPLLPVESDETKRQMLYPIYPQPYGSELSGDVKCKLCASWFLSECLSPEAVLMILDVPGPQRRIANRYALTDTGLVPTSRLLVSDNVIPAKRRLRQFRIRSLDSKAGQISEKKPIQGSFPIRLRSGSG
jgi:hypothetical protein